MKMISIVFTLVICISSSAQSTISGTVVDGKGAAVQGANVYLEGTYDGASTDANGNFSFETSGNGLQTLVVSFISFETYTETANVEQLQQLHIKLREKMSTLSGVTLTAGTFEAGDNARVTALKPLDVVTTASALGDFVGALQTLPGTSSVAEDGRLFVRGGDAGETQIFIDGIRVFTPFTPSARNIPVRGRYSPFLFKGITFSTGGYSAEYGQALSSVLLLNTIDEPDQEKTDIAIMTVGGGVGNTQKWGENSLSVNMSYINLAPYQKIFPDRNTWKKPVEAMSGEAVYRHKLDRGLFKFYTAFSHSNLNLVQKDINYENGHSYALKNNNWYVNASHKQFLDHNWSLFAGGSFTHDNNRVHVVEGNIYNGDNSFHIKTKVGKTFSNRFKLYFGAEYFLTDFEEDFTSHTEEIYHYGFKNDLFGAFMETDIFFSKKVAAKVGLRVDYMELSNELTLSPRVSFAYKTGEYSQFSLAYGNFCQNPGNEYLKFYENLDSEKASHYIFNYQYHNKGQIWRAEVFYKDYDKLIKFDTEIPGFNSNYSNKGWGYAKGLDVFWRDNNAVKNMDYWISYSYLDTKRNYKNYQEEATPNFASRHNFSIVGKYWIDKWKSQLGLSYTFASGRPYTDPNTGGFLSERTKSYNSVSFNWAYLLDQQKILYFSINNALATKNVFGYNYSRIPDGNGFFDRQAIKPSADQFFFIGFFWTLSSNKQSNQLDNL